jgi:nucleoredoxin
MAAQLLAGRPLVFQDGSKVSADEHLADKVVLLYFSASWCGPCRHFTPKLKEFYAELKAQGHSQLEVVFVSMDRSAEEQAEYFRDMHGPWARLEFDDPMNK